MDIQINDKIAQCGCPADLAGKRLVVGAKQLGKALKNRKVTAVYLAKNADPALTEPLAQLCRSQRVPFTWLCSMQELGRACGIDVGATAAAVVESPFLPEMSVENKKPTER